MRRPTSISYPDFPLKILIFRGVLLVSASPKIALAESYWCHFVQQCSMPNGQCGLSSRDVSFSDDQILGTHTENEGLLLQVKDVGTVFVQGNGQSALAEFKSGKIPTAKFYSGSYQILKE